MYCDFVHNELYWPQAANNLFVTSPMLWPLPQLTVATEGCQIIHLVASFVATIVLFGRYRSLWLKAAFERSHRGNSWPETLTVHLLFSLNGKFLYLKSIIPWEEALSEDILIRLSYIPIKIGLHSLLWPEAFTVCCGQRPLQFYVARGLHSLLWPEAFTVCCGQRS